jgi:stromal membrane-associated protein
MNCAGAHRSLGPSITRVKSTKLDAWNKDWLTFMQFGNEMINQFFEHDKASTLNWYSIPDSANLT